MVVIYAPICLYSSISDSFPLDILLTYTSGERFKRSMYKPDLEKLLSNNCASQQQDTLRSVFCWGDP